MIRQGLNLFTSSKDPYHKESVSVSHRISKCFIETVHNRRWTNFSVRNHDLPKPNRVDTVNGLREVGGKGRGPGGTEREFSFCVL